MERRKDNKGKVLNKGETQRKDGTYMYRYYDAHKERKTIYAPTLNELRIKEKEINKDILQGIYTTDMTLNQMFDRYLSIGQNMIAGLEIAGLGNINSISLLNLI